MGKTGNITDAVEAINNLDLMLVPEAEKQANNRQESPMLRETSWRAGQSGNPSGRPKKGWSWKDLIEEIAEEEVQTKDGGKIKWKRVVAKKLFQAAVNGNINAIKIIMERMDGKPRQDISLDGKNIEGVIYYLPQREDKKG